MTSTRPLSCLLLCAVASGCSFNRDDHADFDNCKQDGDCRSGEECVAGFCVLEGRERADAGDGPAPGSTGMGMTGATCESSAPEPCYEAEDPATEDQGVCRGGERQCVAGVYTQCLGQVLPEDEQACNGEDDDCDGMSDEFATATCATPMSGACAQGTRTCFEGNVFCQPNDPVEETCNGEDDDCDKEVDEGESIMCYPDGEDGCETTSDGFTQCLGLCATGMTACKSGTIGCENAIVPVEEACTSGGGRAVDEDCDGNSDEGCPCTAGTMRECYAGPEGTLGRGACRAGSQTCTGTAWSGTCTDQVLPEPETCANRNDDNDCNGEIDDVPGVGDDCIDSTKQGICRTGTTACASSNTQPTCVTSGPQTELCDDVDQDCDGHPANGFDFNSNATCGSCTVMCDGNNTTCCDGSCVPVAAFEEDIANCGACGVRCGTGQFCCQGKCTNGPSDGGPVLLGGQVPPPPNRELCDCAMDCGALHCCYEKCVDLQRDSQNCGGCGNDCTGSGTIVMLCIQGQCGL